MDLLAVAGKRSIPGVLIFDYGKRPVFFNPMALEILNTSGGSIPPASNNATQLTVPKEILKLYERLKKSYKSHHVSRVRQLCQFPSQAIVVSIKGEIRSCRGFYLNGYANAQKKTFHIMMLIEKISEHHLANLDKLKSCFHLTERQIEIVKLLITGASNKGIAEQLYVSEDTIKGHLKHLMRRLSVNSRAETICKVFHL